MSDAHENEESHEGPIKTPKQLIVTVVLSFVVPIIVIIMMANFVAFGSKEGAGSEAQGAEAVAKRLQPVGSVEVQDAGAAPAALKSGEQVYQAVCSACHGAGIAGAPKVGDTAAWAPRIQTGYTALLGSALKGKNAMPPQSGAGSEVEVGRAVVYMANQAGAKFDEPKAP